MRMTARRRIDANFKTGRVAKVRRSIGALSVSIGIAVGVIATPVAASADPLNWRTEPGYVKLQAPPEVARIRAAPDVLEAVQVRTGIAVTNQGFITANNALRDGKFWDPKLGDVEFVNYVNQIKALLDVIERTPEGGQLLQSFADLDVLDRSNGSNYFVNADTGVASPIKVLIVPNSVRWRVTALDTQSAKEGRGSVSILDAAPQKLTGFFTPVGKVEALAPSAELFHELIHSVRALAGATAETDTKPRIATPYWRGDPMVDHPASEPVGWRLPTEGIALEEHFTTGEPTDLRIAKDFISANPANFPTIDSGYDIPTDPFLNRAVAYAQASPATPDRDGIVAARARLASNPLTESKFETSATALKLGTFPRRTTYDSGSIEHTVDGVTDYYSAPDFLLPDDADPANPPADALNAPLKNDDIYFAPDLSNRDNCVISVSLCTEPPAEPATPDQISRARELLGYPTAKFTASLDGGLLEVNPSGTTGQGALKYLWTYGDGGTAGYVAEPRVANPVHLYTAAGTYTVTFTVIDEEGRSSTTQRQVTVAPKTAPAVVDGRYTIGATKRTVNSPQYLLDLYGFASANGSTIALWQPNGGANQSWDLATNLDGQTTLRSASAGKCAVLTGTSVGATVQLGSCDDANAQFTVVKSGFQYQLKAASGLCLTDNGGALMNNPALAECYWAGAGWFLNKQG